MRLKPLPFRLAAAAAALVGLATATSGAAAAPDARLLAAVQAEQPAVVQSLKEMVAIESGTMDAPGLKRMTDWAEARLKALGATV